MTDTTADAQAPAAGEAGRNPAAPGRARPVAPAVTPALVERLARGITAGEGAELVVTAAPLTGEPLASLPQSTPADVEEAYRRARRAQQAWAALPVRRRAAVLLRFHDLLLARQDE